MSYKCFVCVLQVSYNCLKSVLQVSYKCLINFLQVSYNYITHKLGGIEGKEIWTLFEIHIWTYFRSTWKMYCFYNESELGISMLYHNFGCHWLELTLVATPTCWWSTVSDGDLVNGEPPEFATGPFQLDTGCAYKSHQGYDHRPGFVKILLIS